MVTINIDDILASQEERERLDQVITIAVTKSQRAQLRAVYETLGAKQAAELIRRIILAGTKAAADQKKKSTGS